MSDNRICVIIALPIIKYHNAVPNTDAASVPENIIPACAPIRVTLPHKETLTRTTPLVPTVLPQLLLCTSAATSFHVAGNNICLLKTAVATISAGGTYVESNILFDEGSQRSFLAKGLVDCLQVQPHDIVELSLSTFGVGTSRTSKFDVATIVFPVI